VDGHFVDIMGSVNTKSYIKVLYQNSAGNTVLCRTLLVFFHDCFPDGELQLPAIAPITKKSVIPCITSQGKDQISKFEVGFN
jgi:hypothetical protein